MTDDVLSPNPHVIQRSSRPKPRITSRTERRAERAALLVLGLAGALATAFAGVVAYGLLTWIF